MRYIVSQRFFDIANIMVEVALQTGNKLEYELAIGLLNDLITEDEEEN